jgi:hypothetical protein
MEFQLPVCVKKDGSYKQKGTATLLRIQDHYFIVTATHVTQLRHQSDNRSIYLYNYHSAEFLQVTEDICGHDDTEEPKDEFDVNIIRINKNDYSGIPDESFVPLDMLLLPGTLLDDHAYIASGYPASRNTSFPKYKHRAAGCALITKQVPGNGQPVGELMNLYLSYDVPDAPHPAGMSGGAIWTVTKHLPVNPTFSGILVSYNAKEKRITAAKTDYVIALIKAFFPGTLLDHINLPFFIVLGECGGSIHFPTIPVIT